MAPAKATFRVSQTKNSFFGFTSVGVLKRPISVEVSDPAFLFYEEAMCKGSSGKGLLCAAKAVPEKNYFTHLFSKSSTIKGLLYAG